ncbi:hypothetical protein Tco_0668360 [Tanacetum coccineum]
MDGVVVRQVREVAVGVDAFTEEEYVSQFKLYKEFISIASIDKAWTFKSPNDSDGGLNVEWAPFPNEATGASLIMPSPSGSKLFAVKNLENDLAIHLEIWGPFQLEKEICVPQSMHGSMYANGCFKSELDEIEANFFEERAALE